MVSLHRGSTEAGSLRLRRGDEAVSASGLLRVEWRMTAHRRIRRQPRITARVKARRGNGSRSSFLAKKRPLVSNSVGSAGRCGLLQREQAQAVVLLAGEQRPAGQLKQRRHPARHSSLRRSSQANVALPSAFARHSGRFRIHASLIQVHETCPPLRSARALNNRGDR